MNAPDDGPVLVVNSGSSSVKAKLFRVHCQRIDETWNAIYDHIGGADLANHQEALDRLFNALEQETSVADLRAVGHRVVHGGDLFDRPVRVDAKVLSQLHSFIPLAPHHQPHNLAAIELIAKRYPELPQIACFDTAFHLSMPAQAKNLGLPRQYWEEGVRRYGFHGLSYESVVRRFTKTTGSALPNRLIVAHLGNGASLCAIKNGRSVATTMGFSTLDGLPMGTRCGSLDPGVLLHLQRQRGMSLDALESLLYDQSGLLGLSGISSDMRVLLADDGPEAGAAIDYYVYCVVRAIGSLMAALEGLDGLVFTGGVGENASVIRKRVIACLGWLGIALDEEANDAHSPRITRADSTPEAWVMAADEEAHMAYLVCRFFDDQG